MNSVRCRNEYTANNTFYRTDQGLTDVPENITQEAKEVYLYGNKITQLLKNTFSHLYECEELHLHKNKISEIEAGAFNGLLEVKTLWLHINLLKKLTPNMFTGLSKCTELSLYSNNISRIDVQAFHGLRNLKKLWLNTNLLTGISPKLFVNLPRPLELSLGFPHNNNPDNQFFCDYQLCWLKKEEERKTITWYRYGNKLYTPECTNGVDWDTWNCSVPGKTCNISFSIEQNKFHHGRHIIYIN